MIPYTQKYLLDHPISFTPMGEIAGFSVRPGLFDVNGAMALPNGVNFTIHTHNGTSCELLLFERDQEEPFAVLPFPKSYKIGDVYSMIVFDLDIETFEYAYRIDGPYSPEEGMIFDRRNVLLDPYAVAVTGQDSWGSKKKKNYHAKVIRDIFDWGDMPQSSKEMCDLIIYELHVRGFTRHHTSGVANPGTFDAQGKITSDLAGGVKTKRQLGDDYGMRAASGIGREWFEQAATMEEYLMGKTAKEVLEIAVDESEKPTDPDLLAGVTVSIGGYQTAAAKAVENAR